MSTINTAHAALESAITALERLAVKWRALGLTEDAERAEQARANLIVELNWMRTEIGLRLRQT